MSASRDYFQFARDADYWNCRAALARELAERMPTPAAKRIMRGVAKRYETLALNTDVVAV